MSKVRELRLRKCLSQGDLAAKSGVSRYTINRLELGVHKPNYITLRKLSEYFEIEPKELLT